MPARISQWTISTALMLVGIVTVYLNCSTKESREQASGRAKAIYYAAGETSTAICSIAYAAIATAAKVPGATTLLIAMIVFNLISTVVTTRNPTGDYGKALRALRS